GREGERMLATQGEGNLPLRRDLAGHLFEAPHARLDVRGLDIDLGERRDPDLERLPVQLLGVELDLARRLENRLGTEARSGQIARRLIEGGGDDDDPGARERRIL